MSIHLTFNTEFCENSVFLILNFSIHSRVLARNILFLRAGIFQTYIFQIIFRDFRQESDFLTLLKVENGQGLLFISKKGNG